MALIRLVFFSLVSIATAATTRSSSCPRSCDCNYVNTNSLKKTLELTCFVWDIADFISITNFHVEEKFRLNLKCDSAVPGDIDSFMFSSLPHLTSITFNECKISYIHKQAFLGPKNLQEIRIHSASNYHLQFHPYAFDGLDSLENLVLTGSGILRVPNLCDLGNLRVLNVSGNSLSNFKEAGLECLRDFSLPRLAVLDISSNYFPSLEDLNVIGNLFPNLEIFSAADNLIQMSAGEQPLANFAKLRILDLSRNDISELPKSLLKISYDYQEIRLSENKLKQVPRGFFRQCERLIQLELHGNLLDDSIWMELVGLQNLIYVDMSTNKLTFLNQTTITELPRMTFLNLAENLISSIPERTFQNQQRLIELSLAGNQIKALDSKSLHGLLFLKKLALQNNRINSMSADVLNSVPDVIHLNISHNSLLEIPSLNHLTSLEVLDASYNNIHTIPETALQGQRNIKYINLSDNHITEVPDNVFLPCSSLTKLDLSNNFISYLHPSLFMGLRIQTLLLQRNVLQDIGKQFSNMKQLRELNLSSNRIKDTIQKLMFPPNIEMLDLSDNLFEHIRPHAFEGLSQIIMVDLRFNKISTLSLDALKVSSSRFAKTGFRFEDNPLICDCNLLWLRRWSQATEGPIIVNLNITECTGAYGYPKVPLKSIPEDRFLCKYESLCMQSCMCCDFDACDCKYKCPDDCECFNSADLFTTHHIQCSNKNISTVDEYIPKIATMLDYSGNDLSIIKTHSFLGLDYVKTLYLNNSRIELISNGSFVGLTRIKTLRLSNNLITALQSDMFRGLENLENLYLDNNGILEIQDGVFSHVTSLKTLILSDNRLKTMTDYMSTLIFRVSHVSLLANPWVCDCILYFSVRDRPQAFVKSALGRRHVMDLRCVMSVGKNDYKETVLSTLLMNCEGHKHITSTNSYLEELSSSDDTVPEEDAVADDQVSSVVVKETRDNENIWNERMFIFIPAIVVTTLIFIIVIGIMCRREFIKCWLFAKFKCKTSDLELLYDKMRFYDAFVTYHPSDEAFVFKELAIRLERGKPKYHLLLQHRDCPTTSSIPNFISNSVQASHRTIVVLSSTYITDNSFLKCVIESMKNDSVRRLIVITVGDIDSSKVDPVLRTYIRSKNCIRYGEKWFWEKLHVCLPEPGKVEKNIARAEARPYASSDLAKCSNAMMDNQAYEEPFSGNTRPLPQIAVYDYATESQTYEYNSGSQQSSNIYEEIKDQENTSLKYSEPWTETQLRTNVETLSRVTNA